MKPINIEFDSIIEIVDWVRKHIRSTHKQELLVYQAVNHRCNNKYILRFTPNDNERILIKIGDTKLIDCNISVRALNVLYTHNIYTLRDLVNVERDILFRYRNCGKHTRTELKELLTTYKLVPEFNW